MRAILGVLAVTACGVGPTVDFTRMDQGGTIDAALCAQGGSAPSSIVTPSRGALAALAVCGRFSSVAPATIAGDARIQGIAHTAAPVSVTGSLYVGGAVQTRDTLRVNGSLFANADWQTNSAAQIDGDATMAGWLFYNDEFSVKGALNVAGTCGGNGLSASSTTLASPTLALPLDCEATPDIHALAQRASADATQAVAPDALFNVHTPAELTLGCGTYSLSNVGINSPLTMHIVGPTVLVINGSMHVAAPTVIDIADTGSLQLIIDGPLEVNDTLVIGSASTPAVIAVSGAIHLAAPTHLFGTLLAPKSSVRVDQALDVTGSMFVGETNLHAPLTVQPVGSPAT